MKANCRFAMAVHVLAVLAYKEGDRVTSSFLAQSVNTNPVVIRRLLLALQTKHLVETTKGAGAGSRLARSPGRITLAEIYHAVEDSHPFARPARAPSKNCPVGSGMRSILTHVFTSAEAALERELAKKTLGDLLEDLKASSKDRAQAV